MLERLARGHIHDAPAATESPKCRCRCAAAYKCADEVGVELTLQQRHIALFEGCCDEGAGKMDRRPETRQAFVVAANSTSIRKISKLDESDTPVFTVGGFLHLDLASVRHMAGR